MSFVRLRPATRSRGGAVTCRIEHNKDGSGVYRSKLFVLIAADVAAGRGWAPDDRIACEWGQGADHGLIRLVKDPEYAHAYRLRPPNGRNRSTLMLTVATLADWVPREHRKAQPCVTATVKGGLIVTLPAEWWRHASGQSSESATKSAAAPDPVGKVGREIPSSPAPAAPSSPAAAHLTAGQQGAAADKVNARAGGRGPRVSHAAQGGHIPSRDATYACAPQAGETAVAPEPVADRGTPPYVTIAEALAGQGETLPPVAEVWPPFAEGPSEVGIPTSELHHHGEGETGIPVAQDAPLPGPAKAPPAPPEPEPVAGEPDDATGPSWVLERHAGKVPLGRYWTGQILRLGLPETTTDLRKAMPWPSYPECAAALDTLIRNEHEPELKAEFRKLKPFRPTLAEWHEAAGRARAA